MRRPNPELPLDREMMATLGYIPEITATSGYTGSWREKPPAPPPPVMKAIVLGSR